MRLNPDVHGFSYDDCLDKTKNRATVDFLARSVEKAVQKYYRRPSGSGKSGLLSIGHCG
ncbi:MAG TPA: hypothetical protein DHN33_11200, partial [Eubacteriaceae bacterium]|nr:hypothetical protein [Eubacteriaceae bacterium]